METCLAFTNPESHQLSVNQAERFMSVVPALGMEVESGSGLSLWIHEVLSINNKLKNSTSLGFGKRKKEDTCFTTL